MSRITRESFIEYSRKLLADGSKVCPCCLSSSLEFTTDDEHQEYWLECKVCHIGIRDHLFTRVKKSWNQRNLDNPKINKITHNIECTWWNEAIQKVENVKSNRIE